MNTSFLKKEFIREYQSLEFPISFVLSLSLQSEQLGCRRSAQNICARVKTRIPVHTYMQ